MHKVKLVLEESKHEAFKTLSVVTRLSRFYKVTVFLSGRTRVSSVLLHVPAGCTVWPVPGWMGSGWPPAPRQSHGRRASDRPAGRCRPGYSTEGRRSSAPWLHCSSGDDLRKRGNDNQMSSAAQKEASWLYSSFLSTTDTSEFIPEGLFRCESNTSNKTEGQDMPGKSSQKDTKNTNKNMNVSNSTNKIKDTSEYFYIYF